MMKEYNYIDAIIFSLFSKKLYRDVFRNWYGYAWGYLFLAVAIFLMADLFQFQSHIEKMVYQKGQYIVAQTPEFSIVNGRVKLESGVNPTIITDPQAPGTVLAVLDTTLTDPMLADSNAVVVVTSDKLMSKFLSQPRIRDFTKVEGRTFGKAEMKEYFQAVGEWYLIMQLPYFILNSSIMLAILAALAALLLSVTLRSVLQTTAFKAYFRVAIVALTPMLFVVAIIAVTEPGIPYFTEIAGLSVYSIYLGFAYWALKEKAF
jgi:hypothetical protein